MMFIWRMLPPDNRFDLSLDWLSFCCSLQSAILTKEPKMLQPDVFCEYTMQQNATVVGAPPRTPLDELTALPRPHVGSCRVCRGWAMAHPKFCLGGPQCIWPRNWHVYSLILFANLLKLVLPVCQIFRLKCSKFAFRWGSVPDPTEGAYSASRPLAVFERSTSK